MLTQMGYASSRKGSSAVGRGFERRNRPELSYANGCMDARAARSLRASAGPGNVMGISRRKSADGSRSRTRNRGLQRAASADQSGASMKTRGADVVYPVGRKPPCWRGTPAGVGRQRHARRSRRRPRRPSAHCTGGGAPGAPAAMMIVKSCDGIGYPDWRPGADIYRRVSAALPQYESRRDDRHRYAAAKIRGESRPKTRRDDADVRADMYGQTDREFGRRAVLWAGRRRRRSKRIAPRARCRHRGAR